MRKLAYFRRKNIYFGLIYFFVFVFLSSTALSVYTYLGGDFSFLWLKKTEVLGEKDKEKEEQEKNAKKIVTFSTDKPDEYEPTSYEVDPDMPHTIHIPRIQRVGYIQQVGIDQFNNITVPNNIYMAGWYVHSVKPGKRGLTIIDGHRDGVVNKGLFFNLETLLKGDLIEVKYGNGEIVKFKTFKVVTVKEKDARKYLFSKDIKIASQLNLISCVGVYDPEKNNYDKRIIVMAKKI